MDDSKKQAQNPSDSNLSEPVTVHGPGSVESAPISTEASVQSIESGAENHIESSGERTELHIPDEVSRADVKEVTDEPKISVDAKTAGVKESIPEGPNYGNLPTDQHVAQQTVKTADTSNSDPWRALIAIKEFAKGLFGINQPQEVN